MAQYNLIIINTYKFPEFWNNSLSYISQAEHRNIHLTMHFKNCFQLKVALVE